MFLSTLFCFLCLVYLPQSESSLLLALNCNKLPWREAMSACKTAGGNPYVPSRTWLSWNSILQRTPTWTANFTTREFIAALTYDVRALKSTDKIRCGSVDVGTDYGMSTTEYRNCEDRHNYVCCLDYGSCEVNHGTWFEAINSCSNIRQSVTSELLRDVGAKPGRYWTHYILRNGIMDKRTKIPPLSSLKECSFIQAATMGRPEQLSIDCSTPLTSYCEFSYWTYYRARPEAFSSNMQCKSDNHRTQMTTSRPARTTSPYNQGTHPGWWVPPTSAPWATSPPLYPTSSRTYEQPHTTKHRHTHTYPVWNIFTTRPPYWWTRTSSTSQWGFTDYGSYQSQQDSNSSHTTGMLGLTVGVPIAVVATIALICIGVLLTWRRRRPKPPPPYTAHASPRINRSVDPPPSYDNHIYDAIPTSKPTVNIEYVSHNGFDARHVHVGIDNLAYGVALPTFEESTAHGYPLAQGTNRQQIHGPSMLSVHNLQATRTPVTDPVYATVDNLTDGAEDEYDYVGIPARRI